MLAHMVATAKETPPRFFAGMVRSGFRLARLTEKHIAEERAGGPAATLAAFRAVETATSAPPGPKLSWLGEALVHAEDIRRPLGIQHAYPLDAVTRVTEFYAGSNVLIGGKRRVTGRDAEGDRHRLVARQRAARGRPGGGVDAGHDGAPAALDEPARSRCGDAPLALIRPVALHMPGDSAEIEDMYEDDGDETGSDRPPPRSAACRSGSSTRRPARSPRPTPPRAPPATSAGRRAEAAGRRGLVLALGVGTGVLTGPGSWSGAPSSGDAVRVDAGSRFGGCAPDADPGGGRGRPAARPSRTRRRGCPRRRGGYRSRRPPRVDPTPSSPSRPTGSPRSRTTRAGPCTTSSVRIPRRRAARSWCGTPWPGSAR